MDDALSAEHGFIVVLTGLPYETHRSVQHLPQRLIGEAGVFESLVEAGDR